MFDIHHSTAGSRDIILIYVKSFLARMGALMGGGVGLTIGFIFGSYSILRYALCFLAFSPPSFPLYALTHPYKGVVQALAASLPLSRSTCSAVPQHSRSSLPSDRCDSIFLTSITPAPLSVTLCLLHLHLDGASRFGRSRLTRFPGYSK